MNQKILSATICMCFLLVACGEKEEATERGRIQEAPVSEAMAEEKDTELEESVDALMVEATPQIMPEETVFDGDHYAENNPDVVTEWGKDEETIYQDNKMYGKSEGKISYAGGTTDPDASITYLDDIGDIYFKDITSEDEIVQNAEGLFCARDQLLITAKEGVSKAEVQALADQYGFEIVGMIALTDDYQIESKSSLTMEELQNALDNIETSELITNATYNYIW